MSDTVKTNTDTPAPGRKRSLGMRLLRLIVFTGLGLVVLLAGVVGFSETETFRSMLRGIIIDATESSLNAHLNIESIEGNLFAGWKLRGVTLTDTSGTVADIESIVLRYDLFSAPWKRITINELTINAPRISITKGQGRDWNLSTLIKPTEEDTSSSTFDWTIVVENIRLLDATVLVFDSTTPGPLRRDRLDARHMQLDHLNLALSAVIAPDRKSLSINQGSWYNVFGDVSMRNLSGDILLEKDFASVQGLSIQTGRSSFIFSAAAAGGDLLGGLDTETLRRMRMDLSLDAPSVDARDLQYFLPSLDILGGTAALEVDAEGTLDELNIKHLQLEALESTLTFSGTLRRILDGVDMTIDVRSDNSAIHGADVPLILPGIPIMDVSGLGTARFSQIEFHGRPLQFKAAMDMESDAGAAAGNITLDVTGEELAYEGMIRTRGIDLQSVLGNAKLRSDLNLQASIKGQGTRLGKMTAVVNLQADSTRYQRYLANALTLSMDIRRDSLTFDLRSALSGSAIAAEGGMSFQPDSITGFRLSADARKLDLAKILDDDEMSSDLTFALKARGDGVDLSTLSGGIEVAFSPSRLQGLSIDQDTFRLELRQRIGEPELLLLESQYADARLVGQFDLPRFGRYLSRQVDSLTAALSAFSVQSDSSADTDTGGSVRRRSPGTAAESASLAMDEDTTAFMDVRYSMTLKNPDRIAKFFDASTFLVRGTWQGSISGGLNGFDIGGELNLSDFYYVDSARTWLAAGVRCSYGVEDLRLTDPLEQLAMNTRLSVSDLNINGLRLSRAQLQVDWRDGAPTLRLRSLVDTLAQVDIQLGARYEQHAFAIAVPVLQLIYRGETWQNKKEISLRFDSSGIALRQFDLANGAMRISATGTRSLDGRNDFTVYADSLDIGEVEFLLTGSSAARDGESFAGIGFVEATLSGDDHLPLLAADVYIDSLGYRRAHFGEVVLESRYSSNKMELYSELTYETPQGKDEKVFFVSGSIPVSISFDGETDAPAESSANLRMQMRDFPLALIEEFLGLFSPLTGTANADLTVTGTASNPSFNGFMTLSDARGRFLFNNMEYDLGMRIEAVGRDIRIVDLSAANLPTDWRDGRLAATGTITTEAFSISEFDLTVNGRLKVLRFASRSAMRALYGDLYISTGDQPLSYRGRLDRSRLIGDIVIEEGNLVFPLEQSGGAVNKYTDITYVVVDDTTKQVTSSLSAGRFARLSDQANGTGTEARMPQRSVLDGLAYDLTLNTTGRLQLEIPFSVLQEELNAQLIVNNLKVNNFGGVKFVGEVTLGPDSYFVFLGKRMTASGSIRFTRDPQNPDLDLTAVYSDYYIDPRTQVRRQVFVTVRITGTKNKMELGYDLRWDEPNGESVASASDVKSDVVSFLVLGVFTKDVSGSEGDRSSLVEKSPEVLNQIASSLASSAATEFLNRAGLQEYIKRVDIAGLGTQESRVKLTSEIGRAIITYDGKINDLESSNMSVDFPLSRVLGIPWTNLMVQISRKTLNESYESTTQSQQYSVWELKILQRFSF